MKVQQYVMFGLREPALDKVVLSERERQALRRAADILEHLRDLRNGGNLDADDDFNTDVALAGFTCRDLCEREIPVESGWSLLP